MPTSNYAATELREQLERGPYAGEDFFRLNVTGDGRTNWVNITREQLERIIGVLEGPKSRTVREAEQREPFSFTGVLLVRMRADDPDTARELLAAAASAALEADPFIVGIEGTNVARNPAPKRHAAA